MHSRPHRDTWHKSAMGPCDTGAVAPTDGPARVYPRSTPESFPQPAMGSIPDLAVMTGPPPGIYYGEGHGPMNGQGNKQETFLQRLGWMILSALARAATNKAVGELWELSTFWQ